jgi:hypothetical protein
MNRNQTPNGDLLQIAVPNQSSKEQFLILIQAFMRAARQPFPPPESYWANNVASGLGRGTSSMLRNVALGVGGIIYEPYIGIKKKGYKGAPVGFFKGLGGFFFRPIKGCFEFVAHPVVGIINTPNFIYSKIKVKKN